MEELIIVKQLPIIEENLKKLSEDVKLKVATANELICTEVTVKDVKKLRAELNTEFKQLEEQRKNVKNQVMKPYMDFEELYKEYVSNSYKEADSVLKTKIDSVESELFVKKENELIEFFEEQKTSKHIDFITFEKINLNITLSASMKSLKEQIKQFIEKVETELETIKIQNHSEEVLVEYMKHLDVNKAIKDVSDRYIALEKVKQAEVIVNHVQEQEQQAIEKVEEVLQAPVVETKEEEYKIEFVVIATKDKLKKLKAFLIEEGIRYESK